jgi:hypothetical protein
MTKECQKLLRLDTMRPENYIPALESTGSDLYRDSDRAV